MIEFLALLETTIYCLLKPDKILFRRTIRNGCRSCDVDGFALDKYSIHLLRGTWIQYYGNQRNGKESGFISNSSFFQFTVNLKKPDFAMMWLSNCKKVNDCYRYKSLIQAFGKASNGFKS